MDKRRIPVEKHFLEIVTSSEVNLGELADKCCTLALYPERYLFKVTKSKINFIAMGKTIDDIVVNLIMIRLLI